MRLLPLLPIASCTLSVDFDPGSAVSTDPTGTTEVPPPTVTDPETGYPIEGTACSGTGAGRPTALPPGAETKLARHEFPAGSIDTVRFDVFAGQVDVVLGTSAELVVVPTPAEVAGLPLPILSIGLVESEIRITSQCEESACNLVAFRVEVPEPIAAVVGTSGGGSVTVDGAAFGTVNVETLFGDVEVAGPAESVRAATFGGRASVDLPLAGYLEAFSAAGDVVATGAVTQEVCLEAVGGQISADLESARTVYLRNTTGAVSAVLAARPQWVEVVSTVGEIDLTVPAGGYQIEADLGLGGSLDLIGVKDDPLSPEVLHATTALGAITITGS